MFEAQRYQVHALVSSVEPHELAEALAEEYKARADREESPILDVIAEMYAGQARTMKEKGYSK